MNELEKKEEPNNGSGVGCFFAIILAVISLFIPLVIIWLLNLSGIGLKYEPATYFGVCFCIALGTVFFIFFDLKKTKKGKDNEDSRKSNQ